MVFKKETTDADRQPKFVVDDSGLLTKFVAWKSAASPEDRSESEESSEHSPETISGDFHSPLDDVDEFSVNCSVCGWTCGTLKGLRRHERGSHPNLPRVPSGRPDK
jgi:hypothetical protein